MKKSLYLILFATLTLFSSVAKAEDSDIVDIRNARAAAVKEMAKIANDAIIEGENGSVDAVKIGKSSATTLLPGHKANEIKEGNPDFKNPDPITQKCPEGYIIITNKDNSKGCGKW
jgi:hypothetical protein